MNNPDFQSLVNQLRANLSPEEKSALVAALGQSATDSSSEVIKDCPILKKITGDGEIKVIINPQMNNHVVCPYFSGLYCRASPIQRDCSYFYL